MTGAFGVLGGMKRQAAGHSKATDSKQSDAGEVQAYLDYFGVLTPRQIVVHMFAAQAAADTDPDPECQEGAILTLAILRLYLAQHCERAAA